MYCLLLQMSCLFFYELYLVFTCVPRQQHPAGGGGGGAAGAGGEAAAGGDHAGAGAGAARLPAIADYLDLSSFLFTMFVEGPD